MADSGMQSSFVSVFVSVANAVGWDKFVPGERRPTSIIATFFWTSMMLGQRRVGPTPRICRFREWQMGIALQLVYDSPVCQY